MFLCLSLTLLFACCPYFHMNYFSQLYFVIVSGMNRRLFLQQRKLFLMTMMIHLITEDTSISWLVEHQLSLS